LYFYYILKLKNSFLFLINFYYILVLKIHKDAWVISLFLNNKDENITISDVRFKNEADYIRKKGGILIRLIGDPQKLSELDDRDPNHISETDLDDYEFFDIIWENNPPRENLKKLMKKIENKINEKYRKNL
jgi:hypothetical protein